MSPRRAKVRGAVVAAFVAGGALLAFVTHEDEPAESPAHSAGPARGEALAYAIDYEVRQRSEEGALELAGAFTLRGEIELRERGSREGLARVGLAITRCDEASWSVLGETLLADAADCEARLRGHEVVAELDHGALVRVHMPRNLPRAERHLLRGLWQELAFRVEPLSRYQHEEETPRGIAEARFERTGANLVRRRVGYRHDVRGTIATGRFVAGEATLVLDAEGRRERLALTERFGGSTPMHVELTMERVAVRDAVARDLSDLETWRPADDDGRTRRALLEQRVGTLTPASFLAALREFGDGARFPDHERFLWQAAALMRLHPELAAELEPLFVDREASARRRALLVDLLANADTPQSQASMRRVLDTEVAAQDPERHYWVQRVGLVRHPDAATLEWIEARYTSANDFNERFAAAYAFAASHARTEHGERARERLQADLAAAETDTERYHFVRALGATGAAGARDALIEHAQASDSRVRLAAIEALGTHVAYAPDREVFVTALGDQSAAVQLEALQHVPLDAPACEALGELARARRLDPRNIETLVRRMVREEGAGTRELAHALASAGYATGRVAAVLARLQQT